MLASELESLPCVPGTDNKKMMPFFYSPDSPPLTSSHPHSHHSGSGVVPLHHHHHPHQHLHHPTSSSPIEDTGSLHEADIAAAAADQPPVVDPVDVHHTRVGDGGGGLRLKPHSTPATLCWLGKNYELSEGVCIPRNVVYFNYVDFCSKNTMQPVNAASFGKVRT